MTVKKIDRGYAAVSFPRPTFSQPGPDPSVAFGTPVLSS